LPIVFAVAGDSTMTSVLPAPAGSVSSIGGGGAFLVERFLLVLDFRAAIRHTVGF
jgi:hypothetical protein